MKTNHILIAGNVGKDEPKEISTQHGSMVKFSLCHSYKDKSSWFDILVMNPDWLREEALKIQPGENVVVEGRIAVSKSEAQNGQTYTNVSILANSLGRIARDDKKTASQAFSKKDDFEIPF